jgi:hypothetical protein
LIDPLALDGLSAELQVMFRSPVIERSEMIRSLPGFLRVGIQHVGNFRVGTYRLGNEDLEKTDEEDAVSTFDIDSGTLCVVDLNHIGSTAEALTWDRYDNFLRSPVGDNSIWAKITEEIGGPFFGMLSGDVGTPFAGDGRYRLRNDAPHAVG